MVIKPNPKWVSDLKKKQNCYHKRLSSHIGQHQLAYKEAPLPPSWPGNKQVLALLLSFSHLTKKVALEWLIIVFSVSAFFNLPSLEPCICYLVPQNLPVSFQG